MFINIQNQDVCKPCVFNCYIRFLRVLESVIYLQALQSLWIPPLKFDPFFTLLLKRKWEVATCMKLSLRWKSTPVETKSLIKKKKGQWGAMSTLVENVNSLWPAPRFGVNSEPPPYQGPKVTFLQTCSGVPTLPRICSRLEQNQHFLPHSFRQKRERKKKSLGKAIRKVN